MPITSDDFYVHDANPSDIAKLDLALLYIQNEMPIFGAPVIQQIATIGVTIAIIQDGSENRYVLENGRGTIYWDPGKALVVEDAGQSPVGVNSAATMLLHEAAHAIDPDLATNANTPDRKYDDKAEKFATELTARAAAEAGEIKRENHRGDYIEAPNPTEHTGNIDGYSSLYWFEVELDLEIDIGPLVNLGNIYVNAPEIGSGAPPPPPPPRKNPPDEDLPTSTPYDPDYIGLVGIQWGSETFCAA